MTESSQRPNSDGTLDRGRIAIAAALGCKEAIASGIEPAPLDDHYRTRIEQVATHLSQRQCIEFSFECAIRALRVWEKMFPSDLRPRAAVEAVRSWLSNYAPADFNGLSNSAEQSHIDVDYPELTEGVDPALVAAMEATGACSHVALAVQCILDQEGHQTLCEITAWIARFAVKSASDRASETQCQSGRLIAMLLT